MEGGIPLARSWPMWLLIVAVLVILYVPLAPALLTSLQGAERDSWTFAAYGDLLRTPLVAASLRTTVLVAVIVGIATPVLGLLAALSIRELRAPRLILLVLLLPLFIPGVSMGLASAFLFRFLGLPPSLFTIAIVQIMWALPFATLIILTVMATFDPAYLEAAYDAGANHWQAFRDIEFPLIAPGIFGAASFAVIISINETVRTSVVQGAWNTIPTYVWSTYKQVGLSPVLYALMSLVIVATILLASIWIIANRRRQE